MNSLDQLKSIASKLPAILNNKWILHFQKSTNLKLTPPQYKLIKILRSWNFKIKTSNSMFLILVENNNQKYLFLLVSIHKNTMTRDVQTLGLYLKRVRQERTNLLIYNLLKTKNCTLGQVMVWFSNTCLNQVILIKERILWS
jgi:hypothetical protein